MDGRRLFLSPHLDDAAISFGGTLLAEKSDAGTSETTVVATVFSRSNFTREGPKDPSEVTAVRQAEEKAVMGSLGVETVFLGFGECLLRGYTISHPLDYPKALDPTLDRETERQLCERFSVLFAGFDELLIPLAAGDRAHVDHGLVRRAAASAWRRCASVVLRLYEDAPYIDERIRRRVSSLSGWELRQTPIDLDSKLALIRGYRSQPIESWESPIRATAGHPPVERTWLVRDPSQLPLLD